MTVGVALATVLAVNFTTGTVPEVSLEIEACASLPRGEVVRLAGLELDARVTPPPAVGPHATGVKVVCDGTQVRLAVSDPLTGKQLLRTLQLTPSNEAVAARLVALAISELVLTSWMELTMFSPPAANPVGAVPPPPQLRRAAQERAQRHAAQAMLGLGYVLVLGQATGPFAGVGLGWGGGVRLGWTSPRHFDVGETATLHPAVDLDLTGAWTDVDSSLGTIQVAMWGAAPRASLKLRRGRFWVDVGAGGRIGLARIVGAPLDPASARGRTLAGTWAGPLGYLGAGVLLGRFVVAVGVDAGHVLRTVAGRVDDGQVVSVSGNWLTGSLALGWGQ